MTAPDVRIGVDTGGTFTDVVLVDEGTGEVHVTKTPSTPAAFDRGVLAGIDKILDRTGTDPAAVSFLSHGTTVGTNAVLEEEFPRLGLITNEGLRDVLEIGDQTRPELYDLQTEKPPALVPRYLRREVGGRIDSQGRAVEPLDEAAARAVVDDLAAEGVESIVVSFLFSYLDPSHEERVGELIEAHDADLDYALSSAVHPEIREYERTITTVLNEAIRRTVADYLARLADGVEERGIDVPLNVVHSGGGIFTAEQATRRAVRTITSGPAAGAVATRDVAVREGFGDAIGMDMGGTSADVSLVRDGELVRSTEGEVNDLPVKTPMIDVTTVGAGGGSVAWIDEGGVLRVGPRSAGADPGPICYGRGGEEPTVTDANLLLGRIDPGSFLDGEMGLVVDETRDRFESVVADPLGQSVEEAALSVVEVANASIARRVRTVTVERGDDPSDFALVGFGGAGPLQAPAVARRMDMSDVLVPRSPGVFSARGILVADVRVDESRSYREREVDPAALDEGLARLADETRARIREQGFGEDAVAVERAVDVRYRGQSYELTIPVEDGSVTAETVRAVERAFHDTHARLYGHAMTEEAIEVVTLRASAHAPTGTLPDAVDVADGSSRTGSRDVYFADRGWLDTAIHARNALAPGATLPGPAILEESGSTAIVPPGTTAEVTEAGTVRVRL
jgi:N-methylhydantoinase A